MISFFFSRKRVVRLHALAVLLAASALLAVPTLANAAKETAPSVVSLIGVVNVNTASIDELQLLPGVGESRARAILALRKDQGGFRSVDQLVEVKGIGESLLERMRPHVTLQGKTTAHKP
jgi:competence protein ComEA